MGYDPKNKVEKFFFNLAGIKRIPISQTLPAGEMSAVASFWLAKSNTSAIFSTICLTSTILIYVELENWLCIPFAVATLYFAVRVWIYEKCAYQAVKLWT